MALTISLEHLPIDAVEYIAKYLTSSELSNCCAVSHEWRMVFDNDLFWKNRFNKNITDYLKVAKCQVDPPFGLIESDTLQSVGSYREDCLRENRLWQNWRSGRFKHEEIHCKDFRCNIQGEFLNNDHVLLHRRFQTEVWNVSQESNLVLKFPSSFFHSWSDNVLKVVSNRLVVVQCNVVQMFSICLETKTSNLDQVFFFDKTEEFSSSKLMDIDSIGKVFHETSLDIAENFEHVICGKFFLGVVTTDMKNLLFHLWDISNGRKLKEETCPVLPSVPRNVILKAGEKSQDKVIVIFDIISSHCPTSYVFLFDLKKLEFIKQSKVHLNSRDFTLFDKYLLARSVSELKIIDYDLNRKSLMNKNNEPVVLKTFLLHEIGSLRIFQNNMLVLSNRKEIIFIDPEHQSNVDIKPIVKVDFNVRRFEVVQDRFLAFHDMKGNLREIWEVGESSKKIASIPEDSGQYRAVNSACTRLVLEGDNKLIILNFW